MAKTTRPPDLSSLEKKLGHIFRDQALLQQALSHASATTDSEQPDYERLEFLGDRVLALLTAETLLTEYPSSDEGGLASRLNALVKRETCEEVAVELDLGPYILMADAEAQSGARKRGAILSDVCEAVMGALYLDGGLDKARDFYMAHWYERLQNLAVTPREAKSALQEWAQGSGNPLPIYTLLARTGPDHDPVFEIEVTVEGYDPCRGSGSSKRAAERQAAEMLLRREGVWSSNEG